MPTVREVPEDIRPQSHHFAGLVFADERGLWPKMQRSYAGVRRPENIKTFTMQTVRYRSCPSSTSKLMLFVETNVKHGVLETHFNVFIARYIIGIESLQPK